MSQSLGGQGGGGQEVNVDPESKGEGQEGFEIAPNQLNKKEYLDSFWFISEKGKVIVEPHPEDPKPTDQPSAIAIPIVSPVNYKTLPKNRNREATAVFIIENFLLSRKHYKKWHGSQVWNELPSVYSVVRQKEETMSKIKSKFPIYFYLFSSF
jgi:hypothetical protein